MGIYLFRKENKSMASSRRLRRSSWNGISLYILAHQNVRKLDTNSYTTSMTGLKYKLAHRRAEKEKWNATDNTQRKRLIQILQELVDQLKKEMVVGSPRI